MTGTKTCADTNPAYSSGNVSELAARLAQSDGYTIEIWAEPTLTLTIGKTAYFMSVMPETASTGSSTCTMGGDLSIGLGLAGAQPTAATSYDYQDADTLAQKCVTTSSLLSSPIAGVHQFVYQVFNDDANFLGLAAYIDGELQAARNDKIFLYFPAFMDPTHKLFLGSVGSDQSFACSFQGTVFQFSFYDYKLSATEISDSFQQKIANSLPVAYNHTFIVPEDGKYNNEVTDPADYRFQFPADEVVVVACPYYDFDEQPGSFTYNSNNPKASCRIDSIPSVVDAELFTLAGDPIVAGTVLPEADAVQFRVRPAFNKDGISFDIRFTIIDGMDAREDSGTMTIDVEPVNDPPLATATSANFFSQLAQCVALNGTDVDNDITELTFTVHDLPLFGQLFSCDGNGHPTGAINDSDVTLPNQFVGYLYEGSEIGGSDVLGVEHLAFAVSDGQFNSSNLATFTIYPRLVAQPTYKLVEGVFVAASNDPDEYTVNEDALSYGGINDTIAVYAVDMTTMESSLQLILESVPATGVLLFDDNPVEAGVPLTMTPIGNGEFLSVLTYTSELNRFNSPTVDYYGMPLDQITVPAFNYHVVAGSVRSMTVTQGIVVKNVNKAPLLTWTQQTLETQASTKSTIQFLNISGFSITDVDRDVDLLHVHVRCESNCRFYLPKNDLSTYELCDSCPCYTSRLLKPNGWLCNLNNADALAEYHFVATPSKTVEILNSMAFSSSTPDTVVPVLITIYDGKYDGAAEDQGCIYWQNVKTRYPNGDDSSTRTACFSSTVALNVTVTSVVTTTSSDNTSVNVQNVMIVLYTLIAYCALSALFFFAKFFKTLCACCFIFYRRWKKSPATDTEPTTQNNGEQEMGAVPRSKTFRPGEDTVCNV